MPPITWMRRYEIEMELKMLPSRVRLHIPPNLSQRELRLIALSVLGGKCVKCGFDDPRALHLDHIHGGGGAHNRKVSWSVRYRSIIDGTTSAFQVLCANCNWIKRTENREVLGRPRK